MPVAIVQAVSVPAMKMQAPLWLDSVRGSCRHGTQSIRGEIVGMTVSSRALAGLAAFAAFAAGASGAHAQDTIKIGELNSYKSQPAFLEPYRRGWQMAVEDINNAGGVNGK